jgi:lipopolysaccharide/colanic/teichoic acid biosynthesis glycosyltransferase
MSIGLDLRLLECSAREESPPAARRRARRAAAELPRAGAGRAHAAARRALEVIAALVLLAVTGPMLLVAALLVKLTSRGPAFYTQTRVGRGGRPFTIYKLRTMIHNCESLTGPRWAIPDDPRVTCFGHFLRVTHLDELPQLLNVLKGDMSLIGPRPERPEFVAELERALPGYRERLAVRPGVSGLAQVQLAADSDLESVRRKLAYDLYYVRNAGLWLDLRLALCTACRMVGIPFRISGRLFRIPQGEAIEGELAPAAAEATPLRPRAAAA